ncbi:hypothetical protein [Zunongwangia atlantica]|uniref:Uncharacterized protein n=1 Tax=Zunongwangia atlantica 22II14-10F7 TaxID=1185767 RepID=A0A1Y1SXZ4_9FLAO|nr:hypothetical protein [Zunongwangia atlantica]ORL43617.1 hypothetical protein IIF7_19926 [Zunongwangia atlantica 22II14-10F7]
MELQNIIDLRRITDNFEKTPYGFKGEVHSLKEDDIKILEKFEDYGFRELFYLSNNHNVEIKDLKALDNISYAFVLPNNLEYYETFEEFIASNKHTKPLDEYYIHELKYKQGKDKKLKEIRNYEKLQELIFFLKELCTYKKSTFGSPELFFHKPDKICSVILEYSEEIIEKIDIKTKIEELKDHVFEKSDKESRKKIFINEMINILHQEKINFEKLVKKWDDITESYYTSFNIYLSEFSFQKIKNSSQEYFHELTDRIYSTISKFSTYILTIPVAYLFILRFFDFKGESLAKDSFLLIIGISYFIIIWFVLLNNISKAFSSIEKDIVNFQERISNETDLDEITSKLEEQKIKTIPSQKNKIILVKILSIFVLVLTISAYLFIHIDKIIC